ncbi:hypothetical protein [Bacillus gobiensis]|uniref:hypothetical protein n=1 Tax=Bacillus gobiensis TaxID=1441095 RepID=UPI003D1DCE90
MMRVQKILCLISVILLLSGCLYPEEKKIQQTVPKNDQLSGVQEAVNEFKKENGGLLPIKTSGTDTPLYQKYVIDFDRLSPRYLTEPPGTSFENGGEYLYVLTDVENKPTVKLIDLKISEEIRKLKLLLQMYKDRHKYPPFHKQMAGGLFALNYEKLGLKQPPEVTSPVTGNSLPLLIDGHGEIVVDYRSDLSFLLDHRNESYPKGAPIQDIYWKETPFVPAFSPGYTLNEKGEPEFISIMEK